MPAAVPFKLFLKNLSHLWMIKMITVIVLVMMMGVINMDDCFFGVIMCVINIDFSPLCIGDDDGNDEYGRLFLWRDQVCHHN